ncbi:MAG: hypothetical protein ACLUPE_02925 [Turicibacter sanguinis]|uniref:hypothetical protein n=1 Tax=Turicibacter sanguinis TaxID=154288 RepID=UPI0039913FB7
MGIRYGCFNLHGKSKVCLETFIKRQISFYASVKLENRSATEMYRAIHELYKKFSKDTFKTYTVNQGKNLLVILE